MQTPVIVAWVIAVLIQILFPIALMVWFRRRYSVGWRVFLYGALIFFVFQMITRVPVVLVTSNIIRPQLQTSQAFHIAYLAVLGLTAGLFESVGRWVGYKWLFRGRIPYDWANGLAYGIGHAAIESVVLVGLSGLATLLQAIYITTSSIETLKATFPPDAIEQMLAAREQFMSMAWHQPLWGGLERVLTLPFHAAMSLLVLLVFVRGQARWLWLAVALHALVDITAPGLVQIVGAPIWAVEAYIAVWAACGLWLILRLRRTPALAASRE